MPRRLPSQPPVLPGFSTVHILGSGGFADVFLYQQNLPRRQVAIKVMISEVVNDQVRLMFQAEANLMAQLSSHPSILTVYQASVSSDGRPYLVMELCSPALSERYRRERIPVAEVLRIAVQIGSAVETAHRSGVLHRDIKPSNILLTAYGHPVLSDFGIASTLSEAETHESIGLSIPWSAPEVLMEEVPGSVRSEVWSFAATVYSLLAGRSPFELPGEPNTAAELMARINRGRLKPTGRDDVPASLELLLSRALSRKPESRPATIFDVLRELQATESELGLPQTRIEVAMDDWALATVADLEERTRVRGVGAGLAPQRNDRRRRAVMSPASSSAATLAPANGAGTRRAPTSGRAPNPLRQDDELADSILRQRSTGSARGSFGPPSLPPRAGDSSGSRVWSALSSESLPDRNRQPPDYRRRVQVLAWCLVVVAVIAIALGAAATMLFIRGSADSGGAEMTRVLQFNASVHTDSVWLNSADSAIRPTAKPISLCEKSR